MCSVLVGVWLGAISMCLGAGNAIATVHVRLCDLLLLQLYVYMYVFVLGLCWVCFPACHAKVSCAVAAHPQSLPGWHYTVAQQCL